MKRPVFMFVILLVITMGAAFSKESCTSLTYNEMLELCRNKSSNENGLFYGKFLAVRIFPLAGKLATKENKGKFILMADIKSDNKKVFVLIPQENRPYFNKLKRYHGEFDIKYTAKTIFNNIYPVLDMKELVRNE